MFPTYYAYVISRWTRRLVACVSRFSALHASSLSAYSLRFLTTTTTATILTCRLNLFRHFFSSRIVGEDACSQGAIGSMCHCGRVHIAFPHSSLVRPSLADKEGRHGVLFLFADRHCLLAQGCSPTHGVACVTAAAAGYHYC